MHFGEVAQRRLGRIGNPDVYLWCRSAVRAPGSLGARAGTGRAVLSPRPRALAAWAGHSLKWSTTSPTSRLLLRSLLPKSHAFSGRPPLIDH